jgi:hypothetical protein
MKQNHVAEKLWNRGAHQFYFTPHFIGDTMLIKKIIRTCAFITDIYYYYIVDTYDGIKRFRIKHPIYKTGLRFDYQYHLQPIAEKN